MTIDTATLAIMVARAVGGGLSGGIAELLVDSISAARAKYEASPEARTETPFEQKRMSLIDRLSRLQTQAITTIVDNSLLERIIPLIYKNLLEVYEASTEQRLHHIDIEVGQLEGTLQKYQQVLAQRRRARTLAVFASILALGGLFSVVVFASKLGLEEKTVTPLLSIPLPVLLWSAVGSFAAILYRFNRSTDYETIDPIQWLITRPVTGVLMGVIAFFVVKVGLITVAPAPAGGQELALGHQELMWLVAFAAAFSDRFADSILHGLIGRLGGPKDQELIASTVQVSSGSKSSLVSLIDHLKLAPRGPEKAPEAEATVATPAAGKPAVAEQPSDPEKAKLGGDVLAFEPKSAEKPLPMISDSKDKGGGEHRQQAPAKDQQDAPDTPGKGKG